MLQDRLRFAEATAREAVALTLVYFLADAVWSTMAGGSLSMFGRK